MDHRAVATRGGLGLPRPDIAPAPLRESRRSTPGSAAESQAATRPSTDPAKVAHLLDPEAEISFPMKQDPSSSPKDSETRIKEGIATAREKVSAADPDAVRRAGRLWLSLHGEKGVARLPDLHGKDMKTLVEEAKQAYPNLSLAPLAETYGGHEAEIRDGHGAAYIMVGEEGVWVDASGADGTGTYGGSNHENRIKASMAPAVYQIAMAYAKKQRSQVHSGSLLRGLEDRHHPPTGPHSFPIRREAPEELAPAGETNYHRPRQ